MTQSFCQPTGPGARYNKTHISPTSNQPLEDPGDRRVNTFLTFGIHHEKISVHPRQRRCARHAFGLDLRTGIGTNRRAGRCASNRTCCRANGSTCCKSNACQGQKGHGQAQSKSPRQTQSQSGSQSCLISPGRFTGGFRPASWSSPKARQWRAFFIVTDRNLPTRLSAPSTTRQSRQIP